MKKVALVVAVLIVLPVASSVHNPANHQASRTTVLVAEGSPSPVPIPHQTSLTPTTLVAEGSPSPVPIPHQTTLTPTTLVAEGSPSPVPIPHQTRRTVNG
jgi:predicted pyridoxine 5'-phosphate oxidase superfamily flavin-nucleotide-binding protein